jgi:hypothetical protein
VLNILRVVVRLIAEVQWIKRHELVEAEVKRRIVEHEGEVLVPSVLEPSYKSVSSETAEVGDVEGECGLGMLWLFGCIVTGRVSVSFGPLKRRARGSTYRGLDTLVVVGLSLTVFSPSMAGWLCTH